MDGGHPDDRSGPLARGNRPDAPGAADPAANPHLKSLEPLLTLSADAVLIADLEGRIMALNSPAEHLFAHSARDLQGKPVEVLIPERYHAGHSRHLNGYMAAPAMRSMGQSLELRGRRKDGTEFDADILLSPFPVTSPRLIICLVRDITERKRADEAIRQSEERYRHTVDDMMEGFQIIGHDWRYLYINDSALVSAKKSREELIGRTLMEVFPGIENTELFASLNACMRDRTPRSMVNEFAYPDGSTGWFSLSIQPSPEGIFVLSLDITERMKLEEELQQSQKMEAIGVLAGGVAHDFNNLLNVITGFSELAQDQIPPGSPALESLKKVNSAAVRAAELTHKLLAFSRRQVLQVELINLNDTITGFSKMISRIVGEDIIIDIKKVHDLTLIKADAGQVEQVLLNLCTNAREAMPRGGTLTIETRCATLDDDFVKLHPWGRPGDFAELSVTDTGVGMDEVTKARIFEPFFTTKPAGTGLGLAMMYGIVKQHNGFITVYSEPGKGTTFHVYFPLEASAGARRAAPETAAPPTRGSETLLVVEDEAMVRELVCTILANLGYTILSAADGEEAVETFRKRGRDIALVVMDVVMPKLGAIEAYRQMSELRPGLKAVFVSGYAPDSKQIGDLLERENLPLLQKPFSPAALAAKIRQLLDN